MRQPIHFFSEGHKLTGDLSVSASGTLDFNDLIGSQAKLKLKLADGFGQAMLLAAPLAQLDECSVRLKHRSRLLAHDRRWRLPSRRWN